MPAALLDLYRAAQVRAPKEFASFAFLWLHGDVGFERAVAVTAWRGATWVDAHFHGIDDPRALMASHSKVRHLDLPSARMLASPYRVFRNDIDDPEIAAPRFAPLRDHLTRFHSKYALTVALPKAEDESLLTLILVRGPGTQRFTDAEVKRLEALAPHVGEGFAINRALKFEREGLGLPVALVDADGQMLQTTPAFARSFWEGEPPSTAYLPAKILTALRKGRPYPLPNGKVTLYAQAEATGGWLLRLRSSGPVDRLSGREREIAAMFARGVTYKSIAAQLDLAPVTVRNHLQQIYAKVGVSGRDELIAALKQP